MKARRKTQAPRGMIMPFSSAIGMNEAGGMKVVPARCQRISASTPRSLPVGATMGW